jgi:hypothetical protein
MPANATRGIYPENVVSKYSTDNGYAEDDLKAIAGLLNDD